MDRREHKVEVLLSRGQGGDDTRHWRLEIREVASGGQVAQLRLTDEQVGQMLGSTTVYSSGRLAHPEWAARFGQRRWIASIGLGHNFDGGPSGLSSEERLRTLVEGSEMVVQMDAESYRIDRTNFGLRLSLIGYEADLAEAERLASETEMALDELAALRGWKIHGHAKHHVHED